MAGLPWIRLDTALADHPKTLALAESSAGKASLFTWICCLTYAGKHQTGGFIPHTAGPRVHGRAADFKRLVDAGLLDEVAGGWDIHGYGEYQLLDEEAIARREKAKHAATVRWSKRESKAVRSTVRKAG